MKMYVEPLLALKISQGSSYLNSSKLLTLYIFLAFTLGVV